MSDEVHESVAAYGAPPRRWTVRDYYRAAAKGVFGDDEKLELIRGEVVELSPQKNRHAHATYLLRRALESAFPGSIVREHSPIRLDEVNEPEPDVAVSRGPAATYSKRHPNANDLLLVAEVADSSLLKDRKLKGPLYAEFGIPEYWILDLQSNRLEVYRDPGMDSSGNGSYAVVEVLDVHATVTPLNSNGSEISIRDVVPGA